MANIKSNAFYISKKVVIERIYAGSNADELGTLEFWDQAFREIQALFPFDDFWDGLWVKIIDCNSEYNDLRRAQGLQNLEDAIPSTPQPDVCSGLFFSKTGDGLHIMVFRKDWKPDQNSPHAITQADRLAARKALAHELGHFLAYMIKYGAKGEKDPYIAKQITKFIDQLLPSWLAPNAKGEALAESFMAFFGHNDVRGFTSDNIPMLPGDYQQLYTLIKTSYWLTGNLAGSKIITDFNVSFDRVFWQEWEMGYFPVGLKSKGWFSVDRNWAKAKWVRLNGVDVWQNV